MIDARFSFNEVKRDSVVLFYVYFYIFIHFLLSGPGNKLESLYENHLKSQNGTLSFSPTTKEDEGRYSCVIDNDAGERLKKVVTLTVHGTSNHYHDTISIYVEDN